MSCRAILGITRINGESELDYQIRLFYEFIENLDQVECACLSTRIDQLLNISRFIKNSSKLRYEKASNWINVPGEKLSKKAMLLAPLTGKIGQELTNFVETNVRTPIARARAQCPGVY